MGGLLLVTFIALFLAHDLIMETGNKFIEDKYQQYLDKQATTQSEAIVTIETTE